MNIDLGKQRYSDDILHFNCQYSPHPLKLAIENNLSFWRQKCDPKQAACKGQLARCLLVDRPHRRQFLLPSSWRRPAAACLWAWTDFFLVKERKQWGGVDFYPNLSPSFVVELIVTFLPTESLEFVLGRCIFFLRRTFYCHFSIRSSPFPFGGPRRQCPSLFKSPKIYRSTIKGRFLKIQTSALHNYKSKTWT